MAEPAPLIPSPAYDTGRVPPQDVEAEESVLGGVLLENQALDRIEFLREDDFYREKHRKVFAAMRDLHERADPVDLITLSAELKKRDELEAVGGQTFLAYLAGRVPTSANIVHYGRLVQDKSLLRAMIGTATQIAATGYEPDAAVVELLDRAEAQIFELTERQIREPYHKMDQVMRDAFRKIEHLMEMQQDLTGVPTGFSDVDHLLGGLQPSDLVILAARPSMGKTALALNIAQHAAVAHKMPVIIFSLEMGREQLGMRMLSSQAQVDSAQMRRGFLGEKQIQKLIDAAGALSEAPIYIDDTAAINPLELRAKARRIRRLHRDAPLGLVVVDYLQLMQPPRSSDNRAQDVAEISRSLKGLAKELEWPVLSLSQLNRASENRTDKRPMLADLRESGAIEQDADVVAFIFRQERYEPDNPDVQGLAELIIAKNRNGPTSTIKLAFRKQLTAFADYSHVDPAYAEAVGGGEEPGGFDPGVPPAF